ncbi:hypothetical protein JW906_14395, partial [bacterium]|nr:hypothetical protein [bacterium]
MCNQTVRYFQKNIPLHFILISVTALAQSQLQYNRGMLIYGSAPGAQIPTQTLFISNAADGILNWSVVSEKEWITVRPLSGTGSGYVNVSLNPGSLAAGFYYSDLNLVNQDNPGDAAHISVFLNVYSTAEPPFGSFDTPMDGASVTGSVPVTGWVLDDVGIKSVLIYGESDGQRFYIGEATRIEGARPDVEFNYPQYPQSHQAGWGYMLLTNLLPNEGNGTYTLIVDAQDMEGHTTSLGSKTIVCNNAAAVKPFGAIDTPTPGGIASGTSYRNWGWVLTPQPNAVPADGSTINVFVDGAKVGQATYNVYRQDIAALFPGYGNSNSAGACFDLNTTGYSNGLHTIQWTVMDNAGNQDGIGSRYFIIQNSDMPAPAANRSTIRYGADLSGNQTGTQSVRISNQGGGTLNWSSDPPGGTWWSAVNSSGENTGYMDLSVNPAALDPGYYHETIRVGDPNGIQTSLDISVWKTDMSASNFAPFGSFDTPADGSTVSGSIPVTGWALDELGVSSVKIYAKPEGGSSVYIGDAVFVEGARPDIVQSKPSMPMNQKAGWGYMMLTHFLPGGGQGTYTIEAIATNLSGRQSSLGTKTITVDNENAVKPFGAIDSPGWGGPVYGHSARISGWVLTPLPNIIPEDGSTISIDVDGKFAGNPVYNQPREDIAAAFPGYANSGGPGWIFDLDTRAYSDGMHSIRWTVSDAAPPGGGKMAAEREPC